MPDFVKALLQSRKFWLSLISALVGVFLFVRGEISADHLASLCAALGMVLVIAIAAEDSAEKIGAAQMSMGYVLDELRALGKAVRTPHSAGTPSSSFATAEEKEGKTGWTD